MRRLLNKKRRNRAGFSLAETLIAILILLMVSSIVAGAIPTAATVYTKTVDAANAQILLSTVVTVLRDELSTATDISIPSGGAEIVYVNGNDGHRKLVLHATGSSTESIMLYIGSIDLTTGSITYNSARPLVSDAAASKGMIVSCSSAAIDANGVITFTSLTVVKNGKTLANQESFKIRTVKKPT